MCRTVGPRGDFEGWLKGALGKGRLSVKRLNAEDLEREGSFTVYPGKVI